MKKFCLYIITVLVSLIVFSQTSDALFVISNKDTITINEFTKSLHKNSFGKKYSEQEIKDYLNLYINYKLKLQQAYDMQLDTTISVVKQVENYRSTLINPIINNQKIKDSLITEAYNRQKYLIRASHILISIPKDTDEKDTLQYYNKARLVYDKAKKGESFEDLVINYSDDPSLKADSEMKNTTGDLGYFSSMTMLYPFEQACFSIIDSNNHNIYIKNDSIAFCRTMFGYHIIKINAVHNIDFVTMNLQHIYLNTVNHSQQVAKDSIFEAYNLINSLGFDSVASLYSDDIYTAKNGGVMPNQMVHNLPPQYIDNILNMKENEVSEPFQTKFGWHIIKFNNTVKIPEFDLLKDKIAIRLEKDIRNTIPKQIFIANAKKEYTLKIDSIALKELYSIVNDSVFNGTWQQKDIKNNKNLVYFGDSNLKQSDLLQYIFETQTKQNPINLITYINNKLNNLTDEFVLDYATQRIIDNDIDLKENIKEFQDGVLIFELTNENIWNKSVTDSIGLQEFYQNNIDKYKWQERADVTFWYIEKNEDVKNIQKHIQKLQKSNKTLDEIKEELNIISYKNSLFEKNDDTLVDKYIFENRRLKNKTTYFIDTTSITNRNIIIEFNGIRPVSNKSFEVCKGLVVADYQSYLENKWIENLKNKYDIIINDKALKQIIDHE